MDGAPRMTAGLGVKRPCKPDVKSFHKRKGGWLMTKVAREHNRVARASRMEWSPKWDSIHSKKTQYSLRMPGTKWEVTGGLTPGAISKRTRVWGTEWADWPQTLRCGLFMLQKEGSAPAGKSGGPQQCFSKGQSGIELPSLANKNTGHSVKLQLQLLFRTYLHDKTVGDPRWF